MDRRGPAAADEAQATVAVKEAVMANVSERGKHPVSAALAVPYGHPYHPILVTVPIGAWVAGLVFDIASRVVSQPGFLTQASEWLMAIGVAGAIVAAMAGTLELLAIPFDTSAFRTAVLYMAFNLTVTAAYVVNFLWRHADYTAGPRPAARHSGRVAS
jgi:uncharacterized membrane protein